MAPLESTGRLQSNLFVALRVLGRGDQGEMHGGLTPCRSPRTSAFGQRSTGSMVPMIPSWPTFDDGDNLR